MPTAVAAPRITIVKKGLLLIALPIVSQLVLLALMFKLQHDAQDAEKWALHTKIVLAAAEGTFSQFVLAHSDARGAVLTGNAAFHSDAEIQLNRGFDGLQNLAELTKDNPRQVEQMKLIDRNAHDFRDWLEYVDDLVRTTQYAAASEKVKDLSGRKRLDAFKDSIDTFKAEEERLDKIRVVAAEETNRQQQRLIALGTIGTVVLAGVMVVLFTRAIADRIRVLATNAEKLADREPLPGALEGGDEIADLDRVLHQASVRLDAAAETERQQKADIEKRVTELARVNEELTQKTTENEMFVYSVSHDLRSPLVNLQGFSKELATSCRELTEMLHGDDVPEPMRAKLRPVIERDLPDSLHFIQSAVTRSANIIDAMLRLSRAGQLEYRKQAVNIQEIVQRIVDSTRAVAVAQNATFDVKSLPSAVGDPTAIEQVFANLIVNALNYAAPSRPSHIEVGVKPNTAGDRAGGGLLTYYVRDNGLGIPEAYLHKVFGAFQRLHGDTVKGEGIGLALVRRIVERLGGKVWVESAEDVGSTFFVTLPERDNVAEPAAL